MKPNDAPKRVTAQTVAEIAGVSRSAVSRAFTDGAYIDADKRRKIKEVAAQLGYQPNALAASLRGQSSHLIAVFVGNMRSVYDTEFVARLVGELNRLQKWPILIDGGGKGDMLAVEEVMRYPLDALILRGGSMPSDFVNHCVKFNIPIISSGRLVDAPGVDCVCCQHAHGTYKATRMLIEKGRKRIGYIGGPAEFYSSSGRRTGVVKALHESGLSLAAERTGDYTFQGGFDQACELLAETQIDGLICANDESGIGALAAAESQDIKVPDELSVVGFDDIVMAGWPNVSLTTLRNSLNESVQQVLELLGRRLENPAKKSEFVFIEPKLVKRETH